MCFRGQPEVTTTTTTYSVDYGPHTTNGHPHPHGSPDNTSSRQSLSSAGGESTQLVSRKQTQHTTQQVQLEGEEMGGVRGGGVQGTEGGRGGRRSRLEVLGMERGEGEGIGGGIDGR